MASPRKPSPPPNTPKIEQCPRCGNNILIGDTRCSRCGQNFTSLEDSLRSVSPMFVAMVCLIVGGAFVLAAMGMQDLKQLIFVGLGSAIMIGGGVFMGLSYVVDDGRNNRR